MHLPQSCTVHLQAAPNPGGAAGDQLLLSSSRSEVMLWRADGFDAGALFTWPGITRGRFNSAGTQVRHSNLYTFTEWVSGRIEDCITACDSVRLLTWPGITRGRFNSAGVQVSFGKDYLPWRIVPKCVGHCKVQLQAHCSRGLASREADATQPAHR